MKSCIRALLAAAIVAAPLHAAAQAYPERPIRVILPGGAGGAVDNLLRTTVLPVSPAVGQPVVIDHRPGAGGNIGMDAASKSAPDGYTLVAGALAQLVLNPMIDAKMPYNPERDFVPIVLLAKFPYVLAVHPSVPASNAKEFIALVKANPGKFNYGSHGHGTTAHVAAEMFRTVTGTQIVHVPYKSAAAATTDLLGGQVQMMFDIGGAVSRHITAGTLKGIATASGQRLATLPNLPTFEEQGIPVAADTWYALLAPAGTPAPVVARLNAEVNKVLQTSDARSGLTQLNAVPGGGSPGDIRAFIGAERVKWRPIVAASGAKVD